METDKKYHHSMFHYKETKACKLLDIKKFKQ